MKTSLTLSAAVLASLVLSPLASSFAADKPMGEKCYGVVKAGKNDCQTSSGACAGTTKQDGQPDAWLFVPKGTCERIVGASLSPKTVQR